MGFQAVILVCDLGYHSQVAVPPGPPSWVVLVSAVGLEDVEMRWYSAHFLKGGGGVV